MFRIYRVSGSNQENLTLSPANPIERAKRKRQGLFTARTAITGAWVTKPPTISRGWQQSTKNVAILRWKQKGFGISVADSSSFGDFETSFLVTSIHLPTLIGDKNGKKYLSQIFLLKNGVRGIQKHRQIPGFDGECSIDRFLLILLRNVISWLSKIKSLLALAQ